MRAGNPDTADAVVMKAESKTVAGGISLGVTANGILPDAAVTGTVAAWIGTPVGADPTGGVQLIQVAGGVDVTALAHMTATSTPAALSGGLAVAVNLLLPTATVAGVVRAYVGEGIDLNATSLEVIARAPIMNAIATGSAAGISGFLSVNVIDARATVGGYDLDGNSTIDRFATVEAFIGEQSAFGSGQLTDVNVGGGSVSVSANATMTTNATGNGTAASFVGAVNALLPDASTSGRVAAYVRDFVDIVAGSLTVKAGTALDPVDITATATADSIALSFGLAGAGVVPTATTLAIVEAYVGSQRPVVGCVDGHPGHLGHHRRGRPLHDPGRRRCGRRRRQRRHDHGDDPDGDRRRVHPGLRR